MVKQITRGKDIARNTYWSAVGMTAATMLAVQPVFADTIWDRFSTILKYHLCHHSQITLKEGILMTQCELPKEELVRRKELSDNTRKMIYSLLDVAAEDETSLMTTYRDFYLQISFSELHPLMVFYLARPLDGEKAMLADRSNEMNLRSVLGSHSVNENFSCYNYRATHWLDAQMTKTRFFEILDRCVDEAVRGYYQLAH